VEGNKEGGNADEERGNERTSSSWAVAVSLDRVGSRASNRGGVGNGGGGGSGDLRAVGIEGRGQLNAHSIGVSLGVSGSILTPDAALSGTVSRFVLVLEIKIKVAFTLLFYMRFLFSLSYS